MENIKNNFLDVLNNNLIVSAITYNKTGSFSEPIV